MLDSSTAVLESQLDWVTLEVHTRKGTQRLERDATRWATNEIAGGNKVAPFRCNGYYGWQAGRVRFGTREAAGLIQLSGDLAARQYDYLYPTRDNITRLDLAVTVELPLPDPDVGQRHYDEAVAYRLAHPRSARPSSHRDGDGGWTTYIGDRSSDYYLRVYNKEAECLSQGDLDGAAHYRKCWRYELECKGLTCSGVAKSVFETADRPAHVQGFVHEYGTAHGLIPTFPAIAGRHLVAGFRRRSDRDSRLLWVERSVRPAIAWLLSTGERAEVLEALGLASVSAAIADDQDSSS